MQPNNISRFYKKDGEGLSIAEAAIKDLQTLEGNCTVPAGAGEMDWRSRSGGVRTHGFGISTEFIRKGYIDLRGREVKSPGQLAALAQVYRDPRFETLRFIYTRNNIIIGHEGITSKLPASSVAFLNLPDRDSCKTEDEFSRKVKTAQVKFFMDILNRMERLKADGYYLLHNHCSGLDVRPSKEDIEVSVMYKNALSGFHGHVIINSSQYGFIDENLQVITSPLNLKRDKLLEPSLPHPLLGEIINSPDKLACIVKAIQVDPRNSVVIYMSARNRVRAIQEVPDGLFNHEKECVNFLRGRMCEFGASRAFVATNSQQVSDMASEMVKKGCLLDAIITKEDYTVTSVREAGISPPGLQDVHWMGRNVNRGMKVREQNNTDYSNRRKLDLNEWRTGRGDNPKLGMEI